MTIQNMPNNPVVEKQLLGVMLYHKVDFEWILTQLTKEMFFEKNNQTLFDTIIKCYLKYGRVDYILVVDMAKELNFYETIGGDVYLSELFVSASRFGHYRSYVEVVREKYILREIMEFSQNCYVQAATETVSSEELLIDCNKALDRLMNMKVSDDHIYNATQTMELVEKDYALRKEMLKKEDSVGLKTGIIGLDYHTGGFLPSDLIVIAGRPSMGKTAIAIHMAMTMARKEKHILFFSLEMSALQLGNRMLLNDSDIPIKAFKEGTLLNSEENQMKESCEKIATRSITIADQATLNMFHIRNIALRQQRKVGIDAIFIDYLQLIKATPEQDNTRHQELSDITKAIKSLAKELNVPIVLLSQLNRNVEARTDKRPMASDLRDSGAIEEDADIVGLLFRKAFYDRNEDDKTGEFIIAKYRNGGTGTIRFKHNGAMRRFE